MPLRCKVFARLNDCSNWGEVDVTFVQTRKSQSLSFLISTQYRFWDSKASGGLISLTTAVLFCDKISLYGFYPFHTDSHNNTLKYHYYDERDIDFDTNIHKLPKEFERLLKLRDQGIIRLVTDKCQ